jgi:superfamily I DNA/RNA helicase
MSLWWARKEQLDPHQVALIENLPLRGSHLVLGPPGSGKTNVLLRRAQFVRTQNMLNVLVLTFTRALTEFVKTGCLDAAGREIFPPSLVNTLESWIRDLYSQHGEALPAGADMAARKAAMALGAIPFASQGRLPQYDAIFVDEAQDLMPEEVQLLAAFSPNLFFVGDDRQKIFEHAPGLAAVRGLPVAPTEHTLPFHYRLVTEVCEMADRIQTPVGGVSLASSSHYDGPRPGHIEITGPLTKDAQVKAAMTRLRDQIRVYSDLIQQGDRIGVIVSRKADRDELFEFFEEDIALTGKSQVIRSRSGQGDDRDHNPAFDPERPISIMTVQACKGLEFRAVHWLFCDDNTYHHHLEHYYTVVTRAKTRLDISYTARLPGELARSYSPPPAALW